MSDDFDPTNPAMAPLDQGRCGTCGADIPAGARFCPNCGTPRDEADAGDVESTRVMAPIGASPTVEADQPVAAAPVPAHRERPWPWALTVGVPLLILLALLIVLAVGSLSDDDGSSDTTTTTTPTTALTTTGVTRARPVTTRPVVTSPPETDPPATDPPATDPPATDPPVTVTPISFFGALAGIIPANAPKNESATEGGRRCPPSSVAQFW